MCQLPQVSFQLIYVTGSQLYKHLLWQAHLNTKVMGFCIIQESFLLDYDGNSVPDDVEEECELTEGVQLTCLIRQCFVFLQLVRFECRGGVASLCVPLDAFPPCCVTVASSSGYWFKLFSSGSPHG